jgi:hypothetical protein
MDRAGVAGFAVYAGRAQLTHRLIPLHVSQRYRVRVHDARSGPITLRVLLVSGGYRVVPVGG